MESRSFLCLFIVSPRVDRALFLLSGGLNWPASRSLSWEMLVGVRRLVWYGQVRSSFLFLFSGWVETGFASCDITLHRTARASCSIDFLCTSYLVFWMWWCVCCSFVFTIDMIKGRLAEIRVTYRLAPRLVMLENDDPWWFQGGSTLEALLNLTPGDINNGKSCNYQTAAAWKYHILPLTHEH